MQKPGWKTTEFWLAAAAVVIGSLLAAGVLGEGVAAKVAGAALDVLALLGYTSSRTQVKKAELLARVPKEVTLVPLSQDSTR